MVKGTSNGTIKVSEQFVKQASYELGPGDDEGGAFEPWTSSTEYRQIDNPVGVGTHFTPSGDYLQIGNPQVEVVLA